MKSTNIEAQLKKLKSDAPDEAWVISNREKLLAQIETANLSWARRLGLHLNVGWDHLIYAPVRALVIALLLIVGFSTSMMVKASLPNSILYPGRIVIEKVELILAATPEKEAAVYNKHAQQKIADLLKLKETQADEKDIQGTASVWKKTWRRRLHLWILLKLKTVPISVSSLWILLPVRRLPGSFGYFQRRYHYCRDQGGFWMTFCKVQPALLTGLWGFG
jgi:hypothetical protein